MGIFCKIHVIEPPNKQFTPGSVVSGHIKYALDKDTAVKSVNISFRGSAQLEVEQYEGKSTSTYTNAEEYIRIQNNILSKSSDEALSVGEYDTFFQFILPEDIPPSLNYCKSDLDFTITCKITYYVKIKFVIPGTFKFDKKFTKEVTVVSYIKPKLSMMPGVIYGDMKKLFQPLRTKKSVVNLKAYLKKSILEPGEKVELVYNVTNDTNRTIKAIKVEVIEIFTFNIVKLGKSCQVERTFNVVGTDFKTSSIKSGESAERDNEIAIPEYINCLDHSKIVSRDYAVVITVYLPVPYINMLLRIPFQVGRTSLPKFVPDFNCSNNDDVNELPTYWEAMNECCDKEFKAKENKK